MLERLALVLSLAFGSAAAEARVVSDDPTNPAVARANMLWHEGHDVRKIAFDGDGGWVILFDKAGFETLPWPVDYRTSGREGVGLFTDNPIDALETTTVATKEWIGLFAYWLTGKIDSPFPGARHAKP